MKSMILGTAAALVLAGSAAALAQKAPEPKAAETKAAEVKAAEAKKGVEVPKNVFYARLGPTQYLVKSRLIGQTVVDKAGAKLGVVDDVILGTTDNKIDGLVIDFGGKKLGVQITAAKIESKDGKTTITLPLVTNEIVKSNIPAYGARSAGQ